MAGVGGCQGHRHRSGDAAGRGVRSAVIREVRSAVGE